MKNYYITTLLALTLSLSGCAKDKVLTKHEVEKQNKADSVVAEILFETGLDEKASYSVDRHGFVRIEFSEDVANQSFTQVVDRMRKSQPISGVSAEQGGKEVCVIGR